MRVTTWMTIALLIGSSAAVRAEDDPDPAAISAAHRAFWAFVQDEEYAAAAAAMVPDASIDTEGAKMTVKGGRRVQAFILEGLARELGAPRDLRPAPDLSDVEISWFNFAAESEDNAHLEAVQEYSTEFFEVDFPYVGKGYVQSSANLWRVRSYGIGFAAEDEETIRRVLDASYKIAKDMKEIYEEGTRVR